VGVFLCNIISEQLLLLKRGRPSFDETLMVSSISERGEQCPGLFLSCDIQHAWKEVENLFYCASSAIRDDFVDTAPVSFSHVFQFLEIIPKVN
jgi:hypothetical protein